ncbi:DNA topoisomerase VI subunit B [Candidatus Woesearchaeota archaeon]|nr:DNA topoisomerase VI subunit B [Candidatus Woesearchaeota archaeon]
MTKEKKVRAEDLAKGQRAISVAEFFEKNRHLLGFDNPTRALLTTVKEAVDNSLDACEEAKILPEIFVQVKEIKKDRYKIIVTDNGPGIVKKQIGPIFGKLLYGSKFQVFGGKQGRGQQGIGISAAVLYSQLTTGKPAKVTSKTSKKKQANVFDIKISTKTNEPEIISSSTTEWNKDHGTKIELELEARYVEKRASVLEYMKETAVVNPHASFVYIDPEGQKLKFPRVTDKLPKEAKKIKPHPYGVELGILQRMLKETKARSLKSFLRTEFDKVGSGTADEILKNAKLDGKILPRLITLEQANFLLRGMQGTKIMSPSTDCLSPIKAEILQKSLESEYDLDFAYAITRSPSVYRGNPFQIEVAIGYGGELPKEGTISLIRFANKVPLLYQQGACAITKAVTSVGWKSYGLSQSGRNMPQGPAIILVHMASVWAPFTSESKEAIAHYPQIIKEIKLALQEAGRALKLFVGKRKKAQLAKKKQEMFKNYAGELSISLAELTSKKKEALLKTILKVAKEKYDAVQIEEEKKTKIKKRKTGAFRREK